MAYWRGSDQYKYWLNAFPRIVKTSKKSNFKISLRFNETNDAYVIFWQYSRYLKTGSAEQFTDLLDQFIRIRDSVNLVDQPVYTIKYRYFKGLNDEDSRSFRYNYPRINCRRLETNNGIDDYRVEFTPSAGISMDLYELIEAISEIVTYTNREYQNKILDHQTLQEYQTNQ